MVTPVHATLSDLVGFFERHGVRYAVIGGIAAATWGKGRSTFDVDFIVEVPPDRLDWFVKALSDAGYTFLVQGDPAAFVRGAFYLRLNSPLGVPIDLLFAEVNYYIELLDRSVQVITHAGPVRYCTPEDTIILKIISNRHIDTQDVREIMLLRYKDLDLQYIEDRLKVLGDDLDTRLMDRWTQIRAESHDVMLRRQNLKE